MSRSPISTSIASLASIVAPDPWWTPSELLSAADAAEALSPAWFAPLAAIDPATLSPREVTTLAAVLHRLTGVAEAHELRAVGAIPRQRCTEESLAQACRGGGSCAHAWEVEELMVLTKESQRASAARRATALAVAGPLAPLLPLAMSGAVPCSRVWAIARQLELHPETVVSDVVEHLIPLLARQQASAFRAGLRRAILRCTSPEDARARGREARRRRTGVTVQPSEDGLSVLEVTGPVEQMEAIKAVLFQHPEVSRLVPGDERTVGQRRFELLLDLVLADACSCPQVASGSDTNGAAARGLCQCRRSRRGKVDVGVVMTVPWETLEGLSNEPGLVGSVPVHAQTLRDLMQSPSWVRLAMLDARGVVVDLGRKQRFPSRQQRLAVGARSPVCVFPGCARPAAGCEIDHVTAYAGGGRTDLDNTVPLCARHHHLKHQALWQVGSDGASGWVWTMPGGRTVTVPATDHRPQPGPHDTTEAKLAEVWCVGDGRSDAERAADEQDLAWERAAWEAELCAWPWEDDHPGSAAWRARMELLDTEDPARLGWVREPYDSGDLTAAAA